MSNDIAFALNHMAAPRLRFTGLLRLARALDIRAVEIRNDLPGVEIADGTDPAELRVAAADSGIAILSINALYPFEVWDTERAAAAERLAACAEACGAQALVLCPLNAHDDRRSAAERETGLRRSLEALLPILDRHGIIGLVEPLGFPQSALRTKRAALNAIDAVGGAAQFRLVHDTFHHFVAGEREMFPERTGLVHISGVEDVSLEKARLLDEHRVLVGPGDLMDNAGQVRALAAGGYDGPFSFEPFAPAVHAVADPAAALRRSMEFVVSGACLIPGAVNP